jgi:hypothetical protein
MLEVIERLSGEINDSARLFNEAIAMGVSPEAIRDALKPLIREQVSKKIVLGEIFPEYQNYNLTDEEVNYLEEVVKYLYLKGTFKHGSNFANQSSQIKEFAIRINSFSENDSDLNLNYLFEKLFDSKVFSYGDYLLRNQEWGSSFWKNGFAGDICPDFVYLSDDTVKKIEAFYMNF